MTRVAGDFLLFMFVRAMDMSTVSYGAIQILLLKYRDLRSIYLDIAFAATLKLLEAERSYSIYTYPVE
ncbi:hypothetical protein V1478_003186 [Vespula squamosa]|uniref:Uncharacterized protein n=1 Tax=Vespula squamosa TaxID=30214 RepID=A0ABD2BRZ3_VESSQ